MSSHLKDSQKVKIVEEIIILRTKKGMSTGGLVRKIEAKYGISTSLTYELIREARKKVGKFHYETKDSVLEDAIERLETLYEESVEAQDRKTALNIQQEINKLLQLHIQAVEITHKIEQPLFKDDVADEIDFDLDD